MKKMNYFGLFLNKNVYYAAQQGNADCRKIRAFRDNSWKIKAESRQKLRKDRRILYFRCRHGELSQLIIIS